MNATSIKLKDPVKTETARYALEIRGRLQSDGIVVAVEGPDDKRLQLKLFSKKVHIVHTIGCLNLTSLDPELYEKYKGSFVAIKDADFDHLNGKKSPYSNLFLTDKHDIEMTMIDNEIIESIITEYLSNVDNFFDICDGQSQMDAIMNRLTELSYIKWANNVFDGCINFDVIKTMEMYKNDAYITVDDALKTIYGSGANNRTKVKRFTKTDILGFIKTHPCSDRRFLICGHDFCNVLACWINGFEKSSDKNLNGKKIESMIRLQYTKEKFKKTQLYKDIHKWEENYSHVIID